MDNPRLPAENKRVWTLFETVAKKDFAGTTPLEIQSEIISQMKKFNDSLLPIIATFLQKNAKFFSRNQNKKIRENLQDLINDIFFDRMALEMNYQTLKKQLSDQFSIAMPVIGDQK
jgi:polyhydroxyalkanoate synthesis regulator protein